MRHAEAHFFSLEIAKNARVHSPPQIFHCYRLANLQTHCLIHYFNGVASEASDCRRGSSLLVVTKAVFVVFEVVYFSFLNQYADLICMGVKPGFQGYNFYFRDKSRGASMAQETGFNLELCQNKEHQQQAAATQRRNFASFFLILIRLWKKARQGRHQSAMQTETKSWKKCLKNDSLVFSPFAE